MSTFKTIKVLINDDGTVEFDQVGWSGKKCAGDIEKIIKELGVDKTSVKKPEYFKDQQVNIEQRW